MIAAMIELIYCYLKTKYCFMRIFFCTLALSLALVINANNKLSSEVPVDSISEIGLSVHVENYDSLLQVATKIRINDSLRLVALQDSIVKMNNQIRSLKSTIDSREKMLLYDDTCLVTLAYRRCREPYNEKLVKKAIGYYDHIFSPELKKSRSDVFDALRDYSFAYQEVIKILQSAQSDVDRVGNPFKIDEYKQKYIRQLESSMYYRKYMGKKVSVNLPVLQQIIEEALGRLRKHSDTNPADFNDLIFGN